MSVVMRNAPRLFGEENGRLAQLYAGNPAVASAAAAANVRNCNCCPYGYHIDLDFVRYCESLANAKPSEEELQRRSRRRSRKSMEFMLGLDAMFEQWDAAARVQAVPEVPHENDSADSPRLLPPPPASHSNNLYTSTPRPRSSSVPRYTYASNNGAGMPRAESPFGTASSTCSSVRGAESDAPYTVLRQRQQGHQSRRDAPETRAFLRDALDEVCSDFERTLERTSIRRKKAVSSNERDSGGGGMLNGQLYAYGVASDRNNNHQSKLGGANWTRCDTFGRNNGYDCNGKRLCFGWERSADQSLDSCVADNKSPRSARYLTNTSAAPPVHQKLSPAEQQYESYVQATVAANAKSPVEQVVPPPPPPRRHAPPPSSLLSFSNGDATPTNKDDVDRKATLLESFTPKYASPLQTNGAETSAATDAHTLFSIRQQMALSLKRMKDLEEQVKSIPELQHELTKLRDEKQRLQQSLQRKEDELQRAREPLRASASPSPAASLKNGSPVQFTPQRISPVSLESLTTRFRANSSSSERQLRTTPILKRDVATMCGLHATRDIAVGSPVHMMRSVGTNPAQQLHNITDTLHTKYEMEEHTEIAITRYEERRALEEHKETAHMGTQRYVPRCVDSLTQTSSEPKVQKSNASVMASPQTREAYVSCRPEVRSIASSEHTILLPLCEKCRAVKRSIACSTEDKGFIKVKSVSLKLLDSPGFSRSKTFSLGEHERLGRIYKSTGTQYTPVSVHSNGCQTAMTYVHTIGVQCSPEQRNASIQSEVERAMQQTDTRDLIRLCATQISTEEYVPPPPPAAPPEKEEALRPMTRTTASNTEAPRRVDQGINTLPPAAIRHTAANTDSVRKRDVGCGDVVKPHISIACADNYCDSCKDAIKNLAKDFSKVLASQSPPTPRARPPGPVRSASMDSRIPRRTNIPPSPSPVRRPFQRQNTYTITTTSEKQTSNTTKSSLHEKPPSLVNFLPPESASETQSFITEPTTAAPSKTNAFITAPSSAASSFCASDASQKCIASEESSKADEPKPLTPSLDGLIVREEKRVSIGWSRDASPRASPYRSMESSFNEKLKESKLEEVQEAANTVESQKSAQQEDSAAAAIDVSKGARRKTTTLKSSQIPSKQKDSVQTTKTTVTTTSTTNQLQAQESKKEASAVEERPPSKALLQKLAMVEAEPRQKFVPPVEMLNALKTINASLLKKVDAQSLSATSLKSSKLVIQQEWFRISSTEQANPHEVEDYLDCFEEMSVALLEYCVNMVDANGNTAMHYAVSHGNFDVVSILLDSKVCNVNQMNNAGYTCVMLVSLAKLKNAAHRTVVERLFQMADVNIRAKKHCQTALMLAVSHCNNEMVELLLAAGADINIQDEDGSTALMCAAEHGRTDIVKHLLSQPDCDSLIVDVDGATAFKIAWQAGHRDLGLLLYVHEQMLRSKQPHRAEATRVSLELPRHPKPPK
ncbi:KN motif and ankyrin repeat domain-containing protein 2 isoform X2 [Eurosta solidaginis]|uniref:KN motif and ankyrin repeat domain-containing protein 2 isoform X2 n=1 Tax=Eurosta solidaginis TaxID=178769 RepID=UPI0035313AC8